jgi:hypothetical protein
MLPIHGKKNQPKIFHLVYPFCYKGSDRVFMPLDFLPSVVTINGIRLDVDEMSSSVN